MKNKPTNPNQKIRNHTYTSYNEEDDQTDCSRQTARCNGYADLPLGCVCEGVEVRNSADIDVVGFEAGLHDLDRTLDVLSNHRLEYGAGDDL